MTQPEAPGASKAPVYAIVGNPNCGKSTLFNALTGLKQKVGNYPGVTVEKKMGTSIRSTASRSPSSTCRGPIRWPRAPRTRP
jgi:ribosome-binding ATPase YchF (GTP1/OBG family)